MKKYSGMDLAQLTIKVNNRQTKLKNLTLAQESCVKAWAIEMISEKQQNALYESYQNAISKLKETNVNFFLILSFFYNMPYPPCICTIIQFTSAVQLLFNWDSF